MAQFLLVTRLTTIFSSWTLNAPWFFFTLFFSIFHDPNLPPINFFSNMNLKRRMIKIGCITSMLWYLHFVFHSWVYVLGSKKLTGTIESSCKDGLFDDGDNATHWWDINKHNYDIVQDSVITFFLLSVLKNRT